MTDIVTVVGQETVVRGNLRGDEDLTVFGKLEGGVNLTRTLIVESSGVVVADIEVRDAIISGVVVGNITASNSVQITEEGRMVGDISAPRVIIVDGASFKGHVDMGDLGAALPEDRPAVPAVRPRTRSTPALSAPSATARAQQKSPPAREAAARKPAARPKAASPEPNKAKAPARSAPAKPKAPAKPAKKSTRKPPKPPKMPAGKRKVKRR